MCCTKSDKNNSRRENRKTAILFVLPVAAVPMVIWLLWQRIPGLFEENHVVESAGHSSLWCGNGYRAGGDRTARDRVSAIYHATIAVLCLSLFARELDVDELGPQAIWPWIESIFRIAIVLLWIRIVVRVRSAVWRSAAWRSAGWLALSRGSYFVYAGTQLYLVSWFFDKGMLPLSIEINLYFEETLQLLATLFFVLGALMRSTTIAPSEIGARR